MTFVIESFLFAKQEGRRASEIPHDEQESGIEPNGMELVLDSPGCWGKGALFEFSLKFTPPINTSTNKRTNRKKSSFLLGPVYEDDHLTS